MYEDQASMKNRRLKRILLLALGGTIACQATKLGLVPRLQAHELARQVSLPSRIRLEPVDLMERTILFPRDWQTLATYLFSRRQAFDGCVITLGTDSLAYVAGALTLMVRRLTQPVVLTGAMLPITHPGSDAGSPEKAWWAH